MIIILTSTINLNLFSKERYTVAILTTQVFFVEPEMLQRTIEEPSFLREMLKSCRDVAVI